MKYAYTKRQRHESSRTELLNERSSFIPHWRELGKYLKPRMPRFALTDTNRGDRRNQEIIDSTATFALRIFQAGMMAGITSPSRPWFRLTTQDPRLAQVGRVKMWLYEVTERMITTLLRSNFYESINIAYAALGGFGTAAMLVEEDFDTTFHCWTIPVGSFCVANNAKGRVETFMRDFRLTVRQTVERFANKTHDGRVDYENLDWTIFSDRVKEAWERGHFNQWVDICHFIEPNEDHDPQRGESKYKKFSSCYYERGFEGNDYDSNGSEAQRYLKESGYDYFPVICLRWDVTGEDAYGTDCPGMTALGDVKALQLMAKRKAQAIEKMINPPMVGPSILKKMKATILPGDITYLDESEGRKGFRPAHEVNIPLQYLIEDIREHQKRIKKALFEDTFLMMANDERTQPPTAEEIVEKRAEKMIATGPVLERINNDGLDPFVDIVFDLMLRQGDIPPVPEELQGQPLKVEYISIMSQAQKASGLAGMERFLQTVVEIMKGTGDMSVKDKVDLDQYLDELAEKLGISPRVIRSDEAAAQVRKGREQAQRQQQAVETAREGAGAIKDLATTAAPGGGLQELIDMANAGAPAQVA